jgi:diguanylate cyclase (GGDEF)-like protein
MMKKKIEAFLREEGFLRELAIDGTEKPAVDQALIERWQSVFKLIAMEAHEPAALILRVTLDSIRILLGSDNSEQNNIEYYLWHGLYCESASGKSGLLIANTASSEYQNGDHTGEPAITACFGLPIQWPDKALFGVICVLNKPGKVLKQTYRDILSGIRATLEQELTLLHNQHQLLQTSETDSLTSIYNRRKIEDIIRHEFEQAKRYFKPFSVTMIDLNGFKRINDTFGHDVGDTILKAFAQSIGSKIRETDFWGRWGGDEFILVCPYTGTLETQRMFARIKPSVARDMKAAAAFSDFSFGVSQYEQDDPTYLAIVKRADENMYQYKENFKRKPGVLFDHQNAFIR